jgi:hypothetical protein
MKAIAFHLFALCLLALNAAPASAASIGFTGPFDVSNWSFVNTNADGWVDTSGAPNSVVIVGGDNFSGGAGNTDFSIVNPYPYKIAVTFDWSYTTPDSAYWDPFRVGVDGVFTEITNPFLFDQAGSARFGVLPGQVFTLRVHTRDNVFGRGEVTLSNFAAVPEPTSMAVFGITLAGLAIRRRRRTLAAV